MTSTSGPLKRPLTRALNRPPMQPDSPVASPALLIVCHSVHNSLSVCITHYRHLTSFTFFPSPTPYLSGRVEGHATQRTTCGARDVTERREGLPWGQPATIGGIFDGIIGRPPRPDDREKTDNESHRKGGSPGRISAQAPDVCDSTTSPLPPPPPPIPEGQAHAQFVFALWESVACFSISDRIDQPHQNDSSKASPPPSPPFYFLLRQLSISRDHGGLPPSREGEKESPNELPKPRGDTLMGSIRGDGE